MLTDNLAFGGMDTVLPDRLRAPVRIARVARDLGAGYETVRRAVARLVEEGRVVRAGNRGFVVPGTRFTGPELAQTIALSLRIIERFAADLHTAGFDFRGA